MTWTVEHDRKGRFITSDTPVVLWRRPSSRDAFEGIGVQTATEIRFPLNPNKQLVMHRGHRPPSVRVTGDRVAECNADVASACHQYVVGRPERSIMLAALSLSPKRPVLRFNQAAGFERHPDGSFVRMDGDVVHAGSPVARCIGLH